jgi:hypothetical protein
MNELDSLFGDLGSVVNFEDVKWNLKLAGGFLVGTVAWGAFNTYLVPKLPAFPGAQYVYPLVQLVGGVALGTYLRRYQSEIGAGVAISGAVGGILGILKAFNVSLPGLEGFAGSDELLLAGLGEEDLFNRYLNAAPVSVEESMGAAPVSVEEVMNGFDAADEEVNSVIM